MQIRIWGTPEENNEMMNLLKNNFGDKIKIISQPYPSVNGVTQRIFISLQGESIMNDPDENEADSFLEQFSDSVDDAD